MLDTSSTKRDMIMSQNSIAFESDSELVAAFPVSTHSSVKFQQFTCKLCGTNARSESLSSSSDITAESLEPNASVCFEVCQKRLKLKGKQLLQKTKLKDSDDKSHNPAQFDSVPYDMCNDNSILNYNKNAISSPSKDPQKPLSYFGLSKIQRKIKNKKELPLKSKTANKSSMRSGKGVYISQDSDSSISGSSLVCIKDENDSSDNNEVEADEKREVEEGINNLMREHFEAKNAAEHQSKSQRHTIFRKIFSPKDTEKFALYKSDTERVEMKPLNKLKVSSDYTHKPPADDEDSEEVRDKPTSLSPFSYNRDRSIQKNWNVCDTKQISGVSDINNKGRTRSSRRKDRRIRRRNNNLGVCNECKLRMIGAPIDVRSAALSESEASRLTSPLGTQNHSITQLRSSSFKHSPRFQKQHSLPVSRNSSSRKLQNVDTVSSNNSLQSTFLKRSNKSYNVPQLKPNAHKNSFMRRSVSVKSESPAAFRRTHSVRCPSQNQSSKGYTRRRTTTIGACEGNEIISTVGLNFNVYTRGIFVYSMYLIGKEINRINIFTARAPRATTILSSKSKPTNTIR